MADILREWFEVLPRNAVYDVRCLYCKKISRGWDYRKNAMGIGYTHVAMNHMAPMYHNAGFEEEV